MEARALLELKPGLEQFLDRFKDCIKTEPSREHVLTYVSGQLSDLERKSVEPIALASGVPPRTLQDFLSDYCWDEDRVAKRVREIIVCDHAFEGAIGVIDETSFAKKGKKTPGIQRQYCGETGKRDNCVVTVNLGYVADDFHALVDSDLYLPKSWISDPARCREARIPESTPFRTKLTIAVDLVRRSLADGLQLTWVTADEFYGRSKEFRKGIVDLGLQYVVEIPCSLHGWTRRGDARTRSASRVDELWRRRGFSWSLFRVKETQKGPEVWRGRVTRFFPQDGHQPGEECWLLAVQNVLSGETKYFLSSAPPTTAPETLLRVAFSRWRIERIFQDGKGEVGMGDFEVRTYVGLKRHLILTMLSFLFLSKSTSRLRGEKKRYYFLPGENSD